MATASDKHQGGRPRTIKRNGLGRRIEELAAHRRMTIGELAEVSGITLASIYRVTTGETPDPRVSTVQAIAAALGVTIDKLMAPPKRQARRTA